MKKFLLYIWQLPQNILGLLVILFTKARPYPVVMKNDSCKSIYLTEKYAMGVSLGKYIIFGRHGLLLRVEVSHERGHQRQSIYLGPLYLIVIGLPSVIGNLCDRWFHKSWQVKDRLAWYYNLPWESWADRLGGVTR